jgi:5-methylcytosine-specific restriction endonuclease McrA
MTTSQSTERTCVGCGKTEPRPHHSKPFFLCSKECWLKRKRDIWRRDHPIDSSSISCRQCGKEFVPNPLIRYKARYCSRKCKSKGYSESRKIWVATHQDEVRKAHRERHVRRKWGGNHLAALERDGHKCQMCGSTSLISVHHLDNEGDRRGQNHAMENLLTLCERCHRGMHNISLVRHSGQWYVTGKIFQKLNLTSPVPILPTV